MAISPQAQIVSIDQASVMTTLSSGQQAQQTVTATINPYAPADVQDRSPPTRVRGHVSTLTLITSTIAGVTASGGFFGISYLLFGMFTLLPTDENAATLVHAAIVGCCLAFFGSLAIVPLLSAVSSPFRTPGNHWSAGGIRLFAASCGFLTGYICIPLLLGYTAWSIIFALVPGSAGAVGTVICMTPLARRAQIAWQRSAEIDAEWAAAVDGQLWRY